MAAFRLSRKTAVKYLRVTIDSNLSFNSHANAISKKANGMRAFLQRNIKCRDKKVKTQAYNQHVRSTLEFASIVLTQEEHRQIRAGTEVFISQIIMSLATL